MLGMLLLCHCLIALRLSLLLLDAVTCVLSQVQLFGGFHFCAPTTAESCWAWGFGSWSLSFRSWWISCCWTKSIVSSPTRASRAVTTVENDEGRLQRKVTTWSSSEIGAPIELSLSVSCLHSFPFGHVASCEIACSQAFLSQSAS